MLTTSSKTLVLAAAGALLMASPALALSVTNKDGGAHKIMVDEGASESTHEIPGGKTVDLKDVCKDGCGLTGPRGFTIKAKQGDKLTLTDGDFFPTNKGS